jgi:hypothetical protein
MTKPSSDFSHLEPIEKLLIAKHRFRMLSNVLLDVLELNEQKKAFKASSLYKLRRRNEAIGLLYETIANYEIAQICRLWDDFDPNGFSIPTMLSLLDSEEVRRLLDMKETEQSHAVVEFSQLSAEVRRDFLKQYFEPAVEDAIKVINSEELERVKNYRHKYIAHPVFSTRQERKKNIDDPKQSDIEYCVQMAMSIILVLQNGLLLSFPDYPMFRIDFSKTIKPFYESLKFG